jgi:hypothetical protein
MSETQTFDPYGDVVLVLDGHAETSPASPTTSTGEGIVSRSDCLPSIPIKMLVSSKHMILASSVFAAMLKVDYKEGSMLKSKGKVEILLPDDDPEAYTILLNIIHGFPRKVPQQIDLLLLKKLSILVDKYQMQEVVAVFAQIWIEALEVNIPKALTSDLLSWLCISWVFGDDRVFKQVTGILMRISDGVLDEDILNDLPIPEAVVGKVFNMSIT